MDPETLDKLLTVARRHGLSILKIPGVLAARFYPADFGQMPGPVGDEVHPTVANGGWKRTPDLETD